jgi:hypothetical protein
MRIVTSRKGDGFVSVLQPAPRKRTVRRSAIVVSLDTPSPLRYHTYNQPQTLEVR